MKSILVDKRAFMSPRLEYRLRFSVAHETGHLILHRDINAGLQHAAAAEWFDHFSAIPEVEYGWVEWQVYENTGHPDRCLIRRNRAVRLKTVVDSD